ncbi:hypothetical protein DJ64_00285 [Streptomyces griseorubens]|uniref:Uncharacterized protein n=1 Tax=Streptomyces griseorubens TaxID=66897 RepID=A0ABR4TAE4_9ACTN|nr:hypothetical protein DJ64_00285 [Streptomyces griseorubens]
MTSSWREGRRLMAVNSSRLSAIWLRLSDGSARDLKAAVSKAALPSSGQPSRCGVRAMTVARSTFQA